MKIGSITKINPYILELAILILALGIGVFTYIFLTNYNNSGLGFNNRYPFLDKSTEYINTADILLNIVPLRKTIKDIVDQNKNSFDISIYLESLNTGSNIAINQDIQTFPASLAKLPLALLIMKKVENNIWSLDDKFEIKEEDKDSLSGNLYKALSGTQVTIDQLLIALLQDSDNTAQRVFLENVSAPEMQTLIDAIGLEALINSDGKMSAKEYTRLYRSLYFSSYLTLEHSEKILKILSQSNFKDFLSLGLPKDVVFSHKYGEDVDRGIYLDSGIVYLSRHPYMITVMIQAKNNPKSSRAAAINIMKEISRTAYDYFK